jgi:beta-glucosidase
LKIENTFSENKTVKISVDLTNTGKRQGKEVVQLYIRDVFAGVTRPVKELKGFELVALNPNETKTIELILSEDELGFYDNQGTFIVEDGDFEVFVGGSSQTELADKFKL